MKRCMYCGQENSDDAQVCEKCGNELLNTSAEQMPQMDGDAGVEATGFTGIEYTEEQTQDVPWENSNAVSDQPEETAQDQDDPNDVQRGQTYAAAQQYDDQEQVQSYGGQDYGYAAQASAQQNYTGQAYGYDRPADYDDVDEYNESDDEPFYSSTLKTKARKRVKSFLFFLSALCYTVYLAASAAYIVTGGMLTNLSTLSHTLTKYFGSTGVAALAVKYIDIAYQTLIAQNSVKIIASGLVMLIPGVLIMISIWKIFFATSAKKEEISTFGYTMFRVIEILKFIVACIALLAAIALCVSWVVASGRAGREMMTLIISIIVLLVVVIIAVFIILYFVQLLFTLKAVRTNVRDGEDVGKIPGFLILIGFLGAICTAVMLLPMAPDDYIGLASTGAHAAWLLLISLWAVVYRATVKAD